MGKKSLARHAIQRGQEFSYNEKPATNWRELAALGIIYDLRSRRGMNEAFTDVDISVREEILESLSTIIKEAGKYYK